VLLSRGAGGPREAATAVLGGYHVPAEQLPAGTAGQALAAVQEQRPDPVLAVAAADGALDPLVRTTAAQGFVGLRAGAAPPAEKEAVLATGWELLRARPDLPQLGGVITALQPADPVVTRRPARLGVTALWAEQWRFEALAAAGRPAAIPIGLRLQRRLAAQPVRRSAVLVRLGEVWGTLGDGACREASLAAADALPGSDPGRYEGRAASCPPLEVAGAPGG
jgi:hypothetical protein